MHEIFIHGKIFGTETAFSKIYDLEPGTFIELNTKSNSYRVKSYWNIENINILKPNSIVDEFDERFNNCIKSRLISDVPVGSLISGGIDSSSLVYKMLEIGNLRETKLFFAWLPTVPINLEFTASAALNTL